MDALSSDDFSEYSRLAKLVKYLQDAKKDNFEKLAQIGLSGLLLKYSVDLDKLSDLSSKPDEFKRKLVEIFRAILRESRSELYAQKERMKNAVTDSDFTASLDVDDLVDTYKWYQDNLVPLDVVQGEVLESLAEMERRAASPAIPEVLKIAEDKHSLLRNQALATLRAIGDATALPGLKRVIESLDPAIIRSTRYRHIELRKNGESSQPDRSPIGLRSWSAFPATDAHCWRYR